MGVHASAGNVHAAAAELAGVINGVVDLSPIEAGLHDEIFQGGQRVLAGVDAASTDCSLLEAVEHRGADTWGVHLLEASAQGLDPKFTVTAMCCTSSTRSKAWPTRWLASSRATRCAARRCKLGSTKGIDATENATSSDNSSLPARLKPDRMRWRATCERSPPGWRATCWRWPAPSLATRQEIFDFVVTELQAREHGHKHGDEQRIRAERVALKNPRDDPLAFAGVLDGKLSAIAQVHDSPETLVREALALHRLPS